MSADASEDEGREDLEEVVSSIEVFGSDFPSAMASVSVVEMAASLSFVEKVASVSVVEMLSSVKDDESVKLFSRF